VTELQFQIYDIVRRICEADLTLHEAHQTDVTKMAIEEGLADTDFYKSVPEIRKTLNWLEEMDYLRLKPGCQNTFIPGVDLLTAMAARL
jgi:hypothetical protein